MVRIMTQILMNKGKILLLIPAVLTLVFATVATMPIPAYATSAVFECATSTPNGSGTNNFARSTLPNTMRVYSNQPSGSGSTTIFADAWIADRITLSGSQSIKINSASALVNGQLVNNDASTPVGKSFITVKAYLSIKRPDSTACNNNTIKSPYSGSMTVLVTSQSRSTLGTSTINNTYTSGASSTVTPAAGTYYLVVVATAGAETGPTTSNFGNSDTSTYKISNISINYTIT